MPTVTEAIDVDVPVTTAYNRWTQFESFPEFMANRVSSARDRHLDSLGDSNRRCEKLFDAEIVQQIPDTRIAWPSLDGVGHSGVVTFQPVGERKSRVHLELHWEAAGRVQNVGADDRQVHSDLVRFKECIENTGRPDGAWRGTVVDGEA